MICGINASAVSKRKGGASFYIVNIIKALSHIDSINTYYIITTESGTSQFEGLSANFIILPIAPSNVFKRLVWEQFTLPFVICRKYSIDSLFSPNYTAPLIHPGIRSVVTIHDLSFFPLAKLYPASRRLFKPIIHLSVRTAEAVIAVSEFTRQDILKYIGPFDKKIKVVYEAADSRFAGKVSLSEIEYVKKIYKIDGEYILFTGFLEPRKNLERLLLAFASVSDKIPHKLVIAGGEGWWYDTTYNRVKQLGIGDKVIFTGYVADEHLAALYSGATVFAFPSLYEGFGIAVLEAISCGTPVLASNNTALPEVVGNAGVLVDPYNVEDISSKLLSFLQSADTLKKISENCNQVSKKFSWQIAAEQTISVLKP